MIRSRNRHKPPRSERGFVLVMAALMLSALLLLVGFAVDLGSWYMTATRLQKAADAAALAAASSLPDTALAESQANAILQRNGYDLSKVNIAFTTTDESITAKVTDGKVQTYFLRAVKPSIAVTRSATAEKSGISASSKGIRLGSPYNVLGSGDLNIANVPQQNFWLAMNGMCSPAEDGDLFSGQYDRNKGPFTGAYNEDFFAVPASGATHRCNSGAPKNPSFQWTGYSYYVNVPANSGDVGIYAYDAGFHPGNKIDTNTAYGKESEGFVQRFLVYDTNGTPDDDTDDPVDKAIGKFPYYYEAGNFNRPVWSKKWVKLFDAPNVPEVKTYRVQVYLESSKDKGNGAGSVGINGFALGAFKGGQTTKGCNVNEDATCPNVYGLAALSVYNNLSLATKDAKVSYYAADVTPQLVGSSVTFCLWDPGEGVSRIEFTAPDGSIVPFTWSSPGPNSVDTGANFIDTVGTAADKGNIYPGLSSNARFNDRLITVTLNIPADFMSHSTPTDHGLRMTYTVNDSPADRMTWGVAGGLAGAGSANKWTHLVRP